MLFSLGPHTTSTGSPERWVAGLGVLLAHGAVLALAWQAASGTPQPAARMAAPPPTSTQAVLYVLTPPAPPAPSLTPTPPAPALPERRPERPEPLPLAAVAASAVEAPGVRAETTFARLPTHAGAAAPTPPLPSLEPPSVPGLGAADAAHHAALSPNPPHLPSAPVGARGGETRSPRGLPDNRLPSYPPTAREDGLEGTVGLTVELDERGHVLAVRWARRTGHMVLDQTARDAVKSWRFTPALRDGQAVPGVVTVAIHFRLDSAAPQTQATAVADATTP
ncbi:hypothetical protein VITFI_CDS3336 (plasmid) [Vitreoscilla filiformis]|uniref:TonB C-terminal domain-containing protein n=1 Tax=Vitreoscilla filiformis TaxID=63 RepID=A0A221KJS1_VITFI|nr:energy transducer TonB [Vitreoscilla filiformis]ASM79113.1 hypothetical protein VITFI_CDS3336 [Vitreoscilla filiformis]